jgi:RNase P subunit RPR2
VSKSSHTNVIWMRSDYCPGCRALVWGKKVRRIDDGQYRGGKNAWVEWRCECGWQGRMYAQGLGALWNKAKMLAAAIKGEHIPESMKQRFPDDVGEEE